MITTDVATRSSCLGCANDEFNERHRHFRSGPVCESAARRNAYTPLYSTLAFAQLAFSHPRVEQHRDDDDDTDQVIVPFNPDTPRWIIAERMNMSLSRLSVLTCSPLGQRYLQELSALPREELDPFRLGQLGRS